MKPVTSEIAILALKNSFIIIWYVIIVEIMIPISYLVYVVFIFYIYLINQYFKFIHTCIYL